MRRRAKSASGPSAWLRRAKADLAHARAPIGEGGLWETHCFSAQQAAEKALKALLYARGVRAPFIHDIGGLLRRLRKAGVRIPEVLRPAARLTVYAVEARYPGFEPPVTEERFRKSLKVATNVVRWVERRMKGGSRDGDEE